MTTLKPSEMTALSCTHPIATKRLNPFLKANKLRLQQTRLPVQINEYEKAQSRTAVPTVLLLLVNTYQLKLNLY